jgi:hypothetical protein
MTIARRSLAIAAALVVIPLAGCSVIDELAPSEREELFASYEEASSTSEPAFAPPDFVPSDAANLRIRTLTDGPGAILSYESDTLPAGDGCEEGPIDGTPLLDVGWWPSTLPDDGTICGQWTVFVRGELTYAFSSAG